MRRLAYKCITTRPTRRSSWMVVESIIDFAMTCAKFLEWLWSPSIYLILLLPFENFCACHMSPSIHLTLLSQHRRESGRDPYRDIIVRDSSPMKTIFYSLTFGGIGWGRSVVLVMQVVGIHHKVAPAYRARCFIRLLTVLNPAYTLPGGDPRMRDTIASRAILMFWNEPMMCIFLERNGINIFRCRHMSKIHTYLPVRSAYD